MSEKIILLDFVSGGHHSTYINEFSKALKEEYVDFHVLYPKLNELDRKFNSQQSCYKPVFSSYLANSVRFKVIALWLDIVWNLLKLRIQGLYKGELVFIAWSDSLRFHTDHKRIIKLFYQIVQVFGPKQWIGLYFHPSHLRNIEKKPSEIHFLDKIFTVKSCKGIAVLDNGISAKLEHVTGKPVVVFPDITNIENSSKPSELGAKILEKANGRKIVSVLGMQSKRKGVLTVIELATKCRDEDVFFLFGGPLDSQSYSNSELKEIESFVNSNPDNCFFHLKHIQDGPDFNELVNLSEVIYAVYLNFPHSSNLLVKSAYFHKKVLVSNEYYMGEVVRKYQLGASVNPDNIEEIKERIVNNKYLCANIELQKEFFELNSKENLRKTFNKILKL